MNRTIVRILAVVLLTAASLVMYRAHAQTSNTITLPVGGDLQAAINQAAVSSTATTIILEAGASYSQVALPANVSPITVTTSRAAELPAGVRVTPAQSSLLAKIQSNELGTPSIKTYAGAHDYSFIGVEVSTAPSLSFAYALVELGSGGADQNTLQQVPQNFLIDRSYIHGFTAQEVQRGIALNSGNTTISNSYISDIHGYGYDTQAIACWNGTGPYTITNNYLEGAGENVMFGGSPASIPNLVPADITFTQNFVNKPLSWYVNDPSYAGIHWSVKNLFELKNARRVTIEGNVFQGNWTDAQAGRAIVFTPRPSDSGSWAAIEDVVFRNNIVRDVGSGVLVLGADEAPAPTETRLRRLKLVNNLFINIDGPRFCSNGVFATVINKTEDVTIDHNTVAFQTGNIISADYAPNIRFTYTNNITRHNDYGIFGSGMSVGNSSIAYYFPDGVITSNVIAQEINAPSNVPSIYPVGNYFPLSLSTVLDQNYRVIDSAYATLGCDIDVLNSALNGTSTPPTPTPTPTPTPVPSPTPVPQCIRVNPKGKCTRYR